MVKKLVLFILITFILFLSSHSHSFAQETAKSDFFKGKVVEVEQQGTIENQDKFSPFQILKIELDNKKAISVEHGVEYTINENQLFEIGDMVVIEKNTLPDGTQRHFIIDKYRLPNAYLLIAIFFLVILLIARKKGITAIIGLSITVFVLWLYIIPQIAQGNDPLTTAIIGSLFIVLASIYIAHGINKRTSIAILSTIISLILSIFLALIFVNIAKLTGIGSESASSLQFGDLNFINLKGLLLAGIIIGALGVLDDITVNQTALIGELKEVDKKLGFSELYKRGMTVGSEHIISLVNTLVLAYASVSLPIFLFLFATQNSQPLWAILNSEFVIEELVRTLVGSTTLILAVPISTLIAAYFYTRKAKKTSR